MKETTEQSREGVKAMFKKWCEGRSRDNLQGHKQRILQGIAHHQTAINEAHWALEVLNECMALDRS